MVGRTSRREAPHPDVRRVLAGRFAEGPAYDTWRVRGTDDWLLILTLGGSGRVGAADGDLVTAPGDVVLLPPGVRHDYGTALDPTGGAPRWDLAFAHFHPRAEWTPLLDWPTPRGAVGLVRLDAEGTAEVDAELRRAEPVGRGALDRGELAAVNALERALLRIDRHNPHTGGADDRVLRVVDHIGAHLAEPLPLSRLADVVRLSPSRLSHLFVAELGISPQRFVERERLRLAAQLLDLTSYPIARIAAEVGWRDPLYFSQRFRHHHGVTPTEYRRRG